MQTNDARMREMEDKIRSQSDSELLAILNDKPSNWIPEALAFAKSEAESREGLKEILEQQAQERRIKEQEKDIQEQERFNKLPETKRLKRLADAPITNCTMCGKSVDETMPFCPECATEITRNTSNSTEQKIDSTMDISSPSRRQSSSRKYTSNSTNTGISTGDKMLIRIVAVLVIIIFAIIMISAIYVYSEVSEPERAAHRREAAKLKVMEKGSNIFRSLSNANFERENMNCPPIFPHKLASTPASESQGNDISLRSFETSTEYFQAIYDEKNYGTSQWNPYVKDFDYSMLAGTDSPGCKNHLLTSANNMWLIAANIAAEDEDIIPMLISDNISDEDLKRIERTINLGSKADSDRDHKKYSFEDDDAANIYSDCLFVIRKGGQADRLYWFKLKTFFNGRDLPPRDPSKPPIVYLRP